MEIRGSRRYRTVEERREIVEETLKPGVSVSQVARRYDVNTNLVFTWRRQYRQGLLDEDRQKATALVPVKVAQAARAGGQPVVASRRGSGSDKPAAAGIIDIDLGHARVRVEGAADPECVRVTLEGLVR
jgi:transposase